MSEPEFEMYLSLMSKFLRLTSTQKADIAEEMRVHLEDRLAELTAQGKSRSEAIHLALEEFGDAGALAWQFTLPHHIRRRRLIMRYSLGSFVAVAGIFALVSLMWPHRPDHPPMMMQAVAQGGAEQPAENSPRTPEDSAEMERQKIRREIEKKLESRGHEIDFNGSLGQAIEYLGNQLDLDFHFDKGLEADNIAVSLKARQGSLSVATTLELLLRQCEDASVIYVIKDGIVLITNGNADYEVQVYDCRDLLANMSFPPAMGGMGGGMMGGGGMGGGMGGMGGGMGGQFSVPADLLPAVIGQFGGGMGGGAQAAPANEEESEEEGQPQNQPGRGGMGGGMMGVGGGGGGMGGVRPAGGMGVLITVISQATRPAQWEAFDGDGGTMSAFDGMLVVRHNQAVHRKIEEVLEKLRMAKQAHGKATKQEQAKTAPLVIPPGKRLVMIDANGWQLPANALKVGTRVDIITTENAASTKPVIIADLEVAVINGVRTGFAVNAIMNIHSLGFLVTPERAMELIQAEHNDTPLQFLLRGDEEFGKNLNPKSAPRDNRGQLVIPAGKRLVTIPLGNWQIAAESMKVGERIELYEVSGAETTQLDLAFSDLEVAAFSTKHLEPSSPLSNDDEPFELVETLSFVVEPKLALQLQEFQERVSKNGSMVGMKHSLPRGEGENKRAPAKKNAPPETRSELVVPAGKRVVTMIPESWQLPAGTLKVGSKVDLYEMMSTESGYKPELAFPNLEVAAFSARRVERDSPTIGDSTENVWINTVCFFVSPKLAEQLKEFQVRVSYASVNGGATQFVLRGDQDEAKSREVGEEVSLPTVSKYFSHGAFSDSPSAAEVIASLPERNRPNVRVVVEPITLRLDQVRKYPMVGSAQLVHCQYKCVVRSDLDQPTQERPNESFATEVVYIDQSWLVRAD